MPIDNEIKNQINNWFKGDRNYKKGLSLLKEAGFSQRGLLKTLERGETKDNKQHLAFQLFKISDHKDPKICKAQKDEKIIIPPADGVVKENPPADGSSPFVNHDEIELSFEDGTPEAILLAQIVEKQKSHYNKRAQAHKEMTDLGDSNEAEIVANRQEFLAIIEHHTSFVNYLHNVKQQWKESGIMPKESVLIWEPEELIPETKSDIIVDNIPEVDLQSELAKVRSRLSKYAKNMKELSGNKLQAMKAKQTKDEALKAELTVKLNAIRNK